MANTPILTPDQQAQVAALLQKYPDLARRIQPGQTGRGLNLSDPAVIEYLNLNKSLGLQGGYGINPTTGAVEQRGSVGQFWRDAAIDSALVAGGTYAGASLIGSQLGTGAAAGSAGSAGASTSAVPALEGGTTVGANLGAASALPAITAPSAIGAGATAAGLTEGGADGVLGSTPIAGLPASVPLPAGGTGIAGASTGSGVLSSVGNFLNGKPGEVLGAVGNAIGNATTAAGNNRIAGVDQSIRGNQAYEGELMNRARLEEDQRKNALKDVYRAGWYDTRQASPGNTRGLQPLSPATQATMDTLRTQGQAKLNDPAQYDTNYIDPLKPYVPSKPSTLETVGSWAGPVSSVLSTVGSIFGKKKK